MKKLFIFFVLILLFLGNTAYAAPAVPSNLSPCTGAQVSSVAPVTLSWSDVGAYYYAIIISSPGVSAAPYTSDSNSLTIQTDPRQYTWYVKACDENNVCSENSRNCTFTSVEPPVTCSGATAHYPNGCEMLLSYDANGDGRIDSNELTSAVDKCNADLLTNQECIFITSASGRSIQSTCSGCGVPTSGPPSGSTPSPSGGECPEGQICNPLKYGTFQELLDAILQNFFYFFAPSIAVVMFVIAGFMFVISAGDPGRVKKAKDLALWTAIGLAIILLASGLIKVIQSIIGVTPQ